MQNHSPVPFPVVSMGKFSILFWATMGLYALYWFYLCWAAMESIQQRQFFKPGRSLFAVFFVHSLFGKIHAIETQQTDACKWNHKHLTWVFIAAYVIHILVFWWIEVEQPAHWLRLLASFPILLAQYYCLYQVQLAINRINNDPFGRTNHQFSAANQIWIVVGCYLWISVVISVVTPVTNNQTTQAPSNNRTTSVPPGDRTLAPSE
jgi:hypothetical protein